VRNRRVRPQTRVTTGQRRETPAAPPPPTEAQVVAGKNDKFDEARHNISRRSAPARIRSTIRRSKHCRRETIRRWTRCCLQIPGVSQDSAASGELHVRNEHGNIQYRINGIMLPDGVVPSGKSRHRHRRQPCPAHRPRCGAIRPSAPGCRGYSRQGRRLQQQRQRQCLWRQPRTITPSFDMAARPDRPSISCPGAISEAISE